MIYLFIKHHNSRHMAIDNRCASLVNRKKLLYIHEENNVIYKGRNHFGDPWETFHLGKFYEVFTDVLINKE